MNSTQLESRIQDLFEGNLAEDQWEDLRKELLRSKEARNLYCTYAEMHTLLRERAEGARSLTLRTPVIPVDDMLKSQRKLSIRYAAISAAALLVIALVVMRLFFIEQKPPLLVFKTSPGTQYSLSHSGMSEAPEGMTLEKGSRLQLAQGTVELTFHSGVKSIVVAPADLTLHNDNTLFMNQGTAWFQVPQKAVGFQVKTRDLDIVDLGTEFGVIAKPEHHDEVHVITGKVKVTAQRLKKQSDTLMAGEARRIDPAGGLTTIPSQPSAFLTALPKSLQYMHWSFDEVADGGFPAQGNHRLLEKGMAMPKGVKASSMMTDGPFGKALRFTGAKGEEVLTQWYGISGDHPRTVACWIKVNPDAERQEAENLISWGLNKPQYTGWNTKWKLMLSSGGLHATGYHGRRSVSRQLIDGRWHHIACTHRMTKEGKPDVRLYVDGQLVESHWSKSSKASGITAPNTITDEAVADPVLFGVDLYTPGHGHLFRYRGDLDEIYVFEGVLDAEAIKRLATENRYEP